MYKILCGHILSFLLAIYLGVKFLDPLVTPYFTAKLFSKWAALFFISTSMLVEALVTTSGYNHAQVGVKWYFVVALICIS